VSRSGAFEEMRVLGVHALVVSVALIAVAWVVPMPFAGAQLSDVVGGMGVALVLVVARPRVARWPALAMAAFVVLAALSCLVMRGSVVRLAGTVWLVVLALGVCSACELEEAVAAKIRKALVVAALVGAVSGLVGAALYFAGVDTGLLNHPGDLVPGDYPRIRGTMVRANGLAGLLAVGVLLAGELEPRRRRIVRAVLLLALVFTFSRTWIALGGALAVAHYAFGETRRRDGLAVVAALATIGVMLLVSWPTLSFDPSHPWRVSFSDEPGTRFVHLRDALTTISQYPVFGVGPGRAAAAGGWDAHFTLANVGAVMGVPAAIAFAVAVGHAARLAWKRARAGEVAGVAVACCFLVFGFDALARDVEDQRALWILVGLVLVSSRR
jgi:hypothetical protein